MKIQEQWDRYMALLSEKANVFMDSIYPNIPQTFYKVYPSGKIDKCTVINRHYSYNIWYAGKKPNREDVQKIAELLNGEIVFVKERAYFEYSYVWIYDGKESTAKTAIHVSDIAEKKNAFLTIEEAEECAAAIIAVNNKNNAFDELHKKDINYNYQQNGYKFLGWENSWRETPPERIECKKQSHRIIHVSRDNRGTEHIVSCPICKIFSKYDSSD